MGEPESGSAWVFRWNNIEKATSPSESEQHSRGGAVGVSACCLFVCADADGTAASRSYQLGVTTIVIRPLYSNLHASSYARAF